MIDGAALLWRFGVYEFPTGPLPWRHLADLAARVTRPGFVFGDIHAALAYASTGDAAAVSALIAGLEALDARGTRSPARWSCRSSGALVAYASGDYAGALDHLEPVDGQVHRVGGSHAQWELFEETMVACQLRLGRIDDAERLLRRRLAFRPSPRDLAWISRVGQPS